MKKEFIVNRQGKDFALYAGLLDQAHGEGLKRITTSLVQAPSDSNGLTAICHAEVETAKGIFSGIGDANAGNVGRMIVGHIIRMAETRAKARALRDAINVGVACLDELGDDSEDAPAPPPVQRAAIGRTPSPPIPIRQQQAPAAGVNTAMITDAQMATLRKAAEILWNEYSQAVPADNICATYTAAQADAEIERRREMVRARKNAVRVPSAAVTP